MGTMVSQITGLTIIYSSVYSGADQSKHQSSASLAFVRGIHRGPVNSLHKWPVTRKMFPFDDVIRTYWGLNKMTDFWQVMPSNTNCLYEKFELAIKISLKFIPKGSNWWFANIGLGDGLVLNRQKTITCTNVEKDLLWLHQDSVS